MADNSEKHVFVVDDDTCILEVVTVILEKAKIKCTCFQNADDCLSRLKAGSCDLLITDVRMPGKDGVELLKQTKRMVPWLPVLIITSYADIPLAVKVVKAGAADFIEKPLETESFLTVVRSAIRQNDLASIVRGKKLTKTEMIILRLILQSKSNKEIAQILHRSVRTIEVHRSHIMHKLDVDNVVDLVKRASDMRLSRENDQIERTKKSMQPDD